MNPEPSPLEHLSATAIPPTPARRAGFRAIFLGANGIRAGWRFLLYAIFFAGLIFVFQSVLKQVPSFVEIVKKAQKQGIITPAAEFIIEGMAIAAAFLAAFFMSRIEKRSFAVYGIPSRGAFGKLFWQGVLWGLLFETLAMILISALGGYSLGTLALAGGALFKYAVLWALGFTLVGIQEEFTFRGYSLFTLATGIGFWPSAILLSALFGAVHLGNQGEGWVGALSVFLFGLFGCFTLRRTGNLWFIIGFHAASDYAETFIYSVPDSGLSATGHLLNSTFHGPRWLTGGSIGPEGSAMSFVVFLLTFVLFSLLYPPKKRADVGVESQLPESLG